MVNPSEAPSPSTSPIAIPKLYAECLSAHLHQLTTTTQITALIVENTFMSLPRLIPSAMPLLGPFSFLCHQKWESYLKVTFQTLSLSARGAN